MQATKEPAQGLDQLLILADLEGRLHDIRDMTSTLPKVYHPSNYGDSQQLSVKLRGSGSLGLVYKSVHNLSGECVAVWRARVLANGRDDRHITYRWDGAKVTGYFDKSNYQDLP
jgi:hypothetical protein